jgi:hypothetical protein
MGIKLMINYKIIVLDKNVKCLVKKIPLILCIQYKRFT